MNKIKQILFLVEGETEKKLLHALQSRHSALRGKVTIFNICQKPIEKILRSIKSDILYIVYDTDTLHNTDESNRVIQNFYTLKKHKLNFYLIQQTNNLEDELIASCAELNRKEKLYKSFGAHGCAEFKHKLCSHKQLYNKLLEELNFTLNRMWAQDIHPKLHQFNDRRKRGCDFI